MKIKSKPEGYYQVVKDVMDFGDDWKDVFQIEMQLKFF